MPWVSEENLIAYIMHKYSAEKDSRNLNGFTPSMLEQSLRSYSKRRIKSCGCRQDESECDCVSFGLYDDYTPTFQYFIPE